VALWLAIVLVFACSSRAAGTGFGTSQSAAAADKAPKISDIQPSQAQPGSQITVKIEGEHFDPGAYVSFSDPAIHVLTTRRLSETQLEADITVGEMAKQQSVVLYVSNPSGESAQTKFVITLSAPNLSQETRPSSPADPVVTKVEPALVEPGSKKSIKVSGKNFKDGAKVAFSNPGIRVLETDFSKSTQLIAQIEVAPNAPTGKTSLFVINPDDSEVETGFEVGGGNSTQSGTAANTPAQQFSVYNLGDATSILQNPTQAKGQLVVESGKLEYELDGKVVFTAKPRDIQEIAPNVLFGLNTGTFHIILSSGKTYNFVSSSLAPADTNAIVEALHTALK
jgi:IPT/TIG domain